MVYKCVDFDIEWDNGYFFRVYGQPMECRHKTEDGAISAAKTWIDELESLQTGGVA